MVARKTRNRIKRRKTYKQRGSGGGGGGNSTPVDDSHKEAYNEYLKIYALAYDTKDRSVKFEAYKQWLAWKEKYSSLLQFVHIDSRTYLDNLQQYTPVDASHTEAYNEYLKIFVLARDTDDRSVKYEAYKQWLAWKEKYSSLLQFVHIDNRTFLDNLKQYIPDDDSDDDEPPPRGPTNGYYDGGPS